MAAVLNPPVWFYPIAFIFGIALIYWDFYRKKQQGARTDKDDKSEDQPIRIQHSILEATNKSHIDASGAVRVISK